MKRLVAATDFSDDGGSATLRAAMLASEQRAALELLHVVSKPSLDALREWVRTPADVADRLVEGVRHALADLAAGISGKAGSAAEASVAVGDVLGEILSACRRADMLIVGAHGSNPLRDAVLGTTAERLLGKCRGPILVVRRAPEEAYSRVLVPVDFSAYSEPALRMAARIAPNAKITAVHAYDVPFEGRLRLAGVSDVEVEGYRFQAFEKAVDGIRALGEKVSADQYRFGHAVERGDAGRLILDQEQSFVADLIVIGKHGRSAGEALLLGSVTRHVLAASKCDVLVVQEG